jgi:uncharacterized iron-regulated membrane protein
LPPTKTAARVERVTRSWQEWVIALCLVVLAVIGFGAVFHDEIARWRGVDQGPRPGAANVPAPPVAGNTQGTL